MTDIEAIQRFMRLVGEFSFEERQYLIGQGDANDDLAAIAVAAHHAIAHNDANAIRVAIDTAFCLGVQLERTG